MAPSLYNFNMSGKKCSLIGSKCPGVAVGGDSYGCPHWRTNWVTEGAGEEAVLWEGCGIKMDVELDIGISKAVSRAAHTVQGLRNVMARGFFGLCLSAGIDPSPVVAEIGNGDSDTVKGITSLALNSNGEK